MSAKEDLLRELGNPIEPMAVLLCDDSHRKLTKELGREPTLTEAYAAFRGHWFSGVGPERIQEAEHAVCIVDQCVYAVWDVKKWDPSKQYSGKWVFAGSPSLKLAHLANRTVTVLNRQFEANSNRLLNVD